MPQETAVGVRIGAHAAVACRRQIGEFRKEPTSPVKQFLWPITLHPLFQQFHMARMTHVTHRHLVRTVCSFNPLPIHELRPSPALRRAQDDHGPPGPFLKSLRPRLALDRLDVSHNRIESGGHLVMHGRGIITLDHIRLVPVSAN